MAVAGKCAVEGVVVLDLGEEDADGVDGAGGRSQPLMRVAIRIRWMERIQRVAWAVSDMERVCFGLRSAQCTVPHGTE